MDQALCKAGTDTTVKRRDTVPTHIEVSRLFFYQRESSWFTWILHIVKAKIFPVVRYGCESWTINKAESRKIDAFELWCWRRLLRVPWTARQIKPVNPKGNQPWVFIGRTDTEAEAPIFGHLMRRTDTVEKTLIWERLKAKGEGGDREWDGWMASPTQWTWVWANSGKGQGSLVCCQPMGLQSWTWLNDWTTTNPG